MRTMYRAKPTPVVVKKLAIGVTETTTAAMATVTSSCRVMMEYIFLMKAHRSSGLSSIIGYNGLAAPLSTSDFPYCCDAHIFGKLSGEVQQRKRTRECQKLWLGREIFDGKVTESARKFAENVRFRHSEGEKGEGERGIRGNWVGKLERLREGSRTRGRLRRLTARLTRGTRARFSTCLDVAF